jgi:trehalose-6-phosphatase
MEKIFEIKNLNLVSESGLEIKDINHRIAMNKKEREGGVNDLMEASK